jgi:hypothetical protein
MSKINKQHFIGLFAVLTILVACDGGGSEPTVQETQLKGLVKTWNLASITLDGVNKKTSSEYNDFRLTISGTYSKNAPDGTYAYSVVGRPSLSPWPASGTWKFGTGDPKTQLIRDPSSAGEVSITYNLITSPAQLQVTFNYQGDAIQGRTSVVKGQWVMTFN